MNKLMGRIFSGLILAVVLGWAPSTFAQPGLSLDRFQPSLPGDRFFGVEGGDPGGHLLPRLMLLGDYAYRPLTLYSEPDDQRVADLVKHLLILHVAAGVSLWDRLLVVADMPLTLVNKGDDLTELNAATLLDYKSPSGAAAGDLRLSARVRLVGEARSVASLSLGGHLFVPTGSRSKATGEGKVHGMPVLVFSGELPFLAYSASAGVDIRGKTSYVDTTMGTDSVTLGSQLVFGAAVGVLLADKMLQIGPEIYGSTLMVGNDNFGRATTNLEGILGARVRLAGFVVGAAAGPGFNHGMGTPALRALLSVAYAPEPAPPPPPPPPVHKKKKPSDRDHDGIPDKNDACPDEPGVPSEDPAKNGCPPPPPDRDGDGIPDAKDACPDVKGVASNDPLENGCPPDTDGDGIRDDVDACPNEKGPPDTDPQKNGCPKSVRVTDGEIVILEQVQFKTGSAVILPASDDLLRQVAGVLAEHPEILTIEVQGHTDSRGGKAYNKKLSQKRADSVRKWLMSYGQVDGGRLSARGYGMAEPIADNGTAEGRQQNRRVQFKILDKRNREKSEVTP
jgi:outer membrane protein OmpA-like peptidoglycan-associated protein